ncbi:hypothetical protein JST56_01450 [Candidatus Dependentiae bacterium]|nr:hypothetical protein [Candidatus Dependentiae bacterium]
MKNHRKIITVLVALTALVSAQKTYGMKRITNFFSGSSKKEDSRPSREDSSTRPTPSRGSDSRSSSRQTPQELNRTLGELFPGESSRSSSRSGSRESKSSREATKEIEISSPTGFRKTTDDTLSRMKPEDAKMIRDAQAQQTQDVQLKNSIKQAQEAMKLNTQAELKDQEARRSRLDRAIESKPQQSTTESKQRLISEKESRVQELGSKIQAERSKDLSPEEKIESKKIIAQHEKEIMGINKSIREARENERIAKLTPDEHKAEIEQLRQKINERKKEYAMVEKSGDETNIKTAKKEIQRAEAKAKLAEIKLEERLAPQEAESLKKTTGPKKSVTFNEVIETSDNKPKKVYDPEAVPVKGILKKPTESSDASPTTKPVETKTQETLELSPAMKRKMEAAQKAFETQELKTMTPAMQKRMEAEQKAFEKRATAQKPAAQEDVFSASKFD